MYVIRPQFFVPMITLLRNAASKSIQVRNELELYKNQNINITTFENDLNEFKKESSSVFKNTFIAEEGKIYSF